jgi:integrase
LAICHERGRNAGIPPPTPHDLRRTWTADLLEEGIDLATVQKLAVQRQATAVLNVPFKVTDA